MPMPPLDAATVSLIRDRLHTAVLGDVLDAMGLRMQFLPQTIRPLLPTVRIVGRAMTVREEDTSDPATNFGRLFEALDQIGAGEIYVAAGGSGTYAMWGELMSRTARARGAVGAVMSGPMRDTPAVRALEFPVFSTGPMPATSAAAVRLSTTAASSNSAASPSKTATWWLATRTAC